MGEASAVIKARLASALGPNGLSYWRMLSEYVIGKRSRSEFDSSVRQYLNTRDLTILHNAFISSLIAAASTYSPPSEEGTSAPPPRKRRRLLPHQDAPPKLKRWALGIGKKERDRIKTIIGRKDGVHPAVRPISLRAEGKNPPGTRVPLPLCSVTRSLPTPQQLHERLSLIASQHQLGTTRPIIALVSEAVDSHLKQLAMHAISLTSGPHPFTSVTPSSPTIKRPLTLASFNALLTVAPASLPRASAAAINLALTQGEEDEEADAGEQFVSGDGAWSQYWRLLGERSGVREQLARTKAF